MKMHETEDLENLSAIDIVRVSMAYWFNKLGIKSDTLSEANSDFYVWELISSNDDETRINGSFELRGVCVQIKLLLEWNGPNAALIRFFTIHTDNADEVVLGHHVARRESVHDSWHVTPKVHSTEKQNALKELLAV